MVLVITPPIGGHVIAFGPIFVEVVEVAAVRDAR
jgi:hypothetical protein